MKKNSIVRVDGLVEVPVTSRLLSLVERRRRKKEGEEEEKKKKKR